MDALGVEQSGLTRTELRTVMLAVVLAFGAFLASEGLRWVLAEPEVHVNAMRENLRAPTRLDLNTASRHELMLLTGVGPHIADAIIAYREEHGPFPRLEDIQNVRGIGPKTLENLRPNLMCSPGEERE